MQLLRKPRKTLISGLTPECIFGSRPEKNDPEIDKLNFWSTLIGLLYTDKSKVKSVAFSEYMNFKPYYYKKIQKKQSCIFLVFGGF